MHVREVENGPNPARASRDLEDVVQRPEIANPAHHLDPERHAATLSLEPLAERPELLHDRIERGLPRSLEQEPRMEDDELGAARGGDAGASIERADRRGELAAARLDVAHEAEERRVHREGDSILRGELAEPFGERVVHPEPALEVDLTGCVAALAQKVDRLFGRLSRRHPSRPHTDGR